MKKLVLVGDSIFDNGTYTEGQPDVAGHLSRLVWPEEVVLCAVDRTTTLDVHKQLNKIPKDACHVFLSLGGNDALLNSDVLDLPATSTGQALDMFKSRIDAFELSYNQALAAIVSPSHVTTVCTIYNGNLPPEEAARARIALMMFNDVILRAAFRLGANVLDLRFVCTEPADFANPIEPSGQGGLKIARAIAHGAHVSCVTMG
jgi:hypothetical protein